MSKLKRLLFGSEDGEYKQVIAVRADLKMGKGKLAAQVAHAAVEAADKSRHKSQWKDEGQRKVVVKVSGEKELLRVLAEARDYGLPTSLIEDAGHTQLEPGTKTAVGVGPAPEDDVDKITGKLKLM
ncbi:MAG: peptidyl-tRNA hydrolase [Candidatus Altiarchaeales archaeon]|nr:peptidyl-tRNA hydrolase [Candidatus Altiarchaeales archaeon]MBD3415716.1 peptidyl-tRNA hydrolase [Candidatus Altiarchaeales archaeon]